MKTRAVILAGGEGSRLGTLTAKRTKPAVPFAGKYRIIDFTLSNCVNSGLFDVMILAQYRPHSLIDHIGAGGPWDLNRDFTGGVRIYTPYKARGTSDWYLGTADAVQQNFRFIKIHIRTCSNLVRDHIYEMNYDALIAFHIDQEADVTMGTIRVPIDEAARFGIVDVDENFQVVSFVEKPERPPSNLVNMGVYLFNIELLDQVLWEDHSRQESSHDFGKDILPRLVVGGDTKVCAFPYTGYWVDVGTVESYWKAHMDLLSEPPALDLNDRSWIIHTRTEEQPPVRIARDAKVIDSMVTDGCILGSGALVERSVLSPGVRLPLAQWFRVGAFDGFGNWSERLLKDVLLTNTSVSGGCQVGKIEEKDVFRLTMVGKNSHLPANLTVQPGAVIATDVIPSDFRTKLIRNDEYIQTKRYPYEF
jgi:glucose-1-phosphate adenylyltransferase